MREILLTSSVLIAALLVLRKAFQKTISRRVQYALWGLVVLRLLVPVNLPALHYNVLTAAEPVQTQVAARLERQTVALPVERAPLDQHPLPAVEPLGIHGDVQAGGEEVGDHIIRAGSPGQIYLHYLLTSFT